jgi:putative ABC transport system permease protein
MSLFNDMRIGGRLLLKDRWFTLAAVFTLAIGIAATNTVFTILNATLLRPLPVEEAERLVDLGEVSYLDLQDWRLRMRTVDGIAAFDERSLSLADETYAAERVLGGYVSANTFAVVRQRPLLGRDFRPEDERAGAPPVVILGYQIWRVRYQSDPGIVGGTIRVNGQPTTVVGVMPEGFAFPQISQLWVPLSMLRAEALTARNQQILAAFGRLGPGATRAQARAELVTVLEQLSREYPGEQRQLERPVRVFRSGVGADTPVSVAFTFMLGAVMFVLLIACANVANLLLARSAARSREVSLRLSLGASRWQIIRQLLTESAMLAVLAGITAAAASVAALDAFWRAVLQSGEAPPYWLTLEMDFRVLAFLLTMCLGAAVLSGLAPAWVTTRVNLVGLLSDIGGRHSGSRATRRWTSAIVVGQLALALVLLSGAGLMIRSLLAQVRTEAGVDTAPLVTARLDLPGAAYATPEQRLALYRRVEEHFASVPGVQLSFASEVPLAGAPPRELITDLQQTASSDQQPVIGQMTVGSRYFEVLGTRLRRGRMFRPVDADAGRVAIVNERLAEMHFPGVDPIGRQIQVVPPGQSAAEAPWLTIVGIAPNVRQQSNEGGSFDPLVYVAADFNPVIGTTLIAQSASDPGTVARILRREMQAVDPDLPLFNIRRVDDTLVAERWAQRFTGWLFSIVAGLALILAIVGLYAVTAYAASTRTREIALRVALGARSSDVWRTVTAGAARQAAAGLLIGIAGGVAISRILPSQLTGAVGSDPLTFAAAAVLLVIACLIAASVPARRALKLDPMTALRTE